ncbi:hypothetical protein NQ317_006163 [Molorchus minor]|uniref:Glucuronosyltransferase n=1 Tax=Molorchus minor TaxID=1323400 RepID=A0ABQ9J909_9CUCU|nr:hypothetical protein NQ317_006163 [Molorchus minor]
MLKYVLFVLYTSVVSLSYGANILAIVPTPSYSHQIAFRPIWKELLLRGHHLTLITTDPMDDPKLVNLTEIDMKWAYKFFDANRTEMAQQPWSMWRLPTSFQEMFSMIAEAQLSYPAVEELIRSQKHFDVVLVEYFYPEFLGFAETCDSPGILIGSLDIFSLIHGMVGNPSHPVLYPEFGTPFYGTLTLPERIESTLYTWYFSYYFTHRGYPARQKIIEKYFNTTLSLVDAISDIDLLLLNVNPVLQYVRPVGPATVNFGGFRHIRRSSKDIPKDLKKFMDNAKDGFIYFSLGSNVQSKELSGSSLNSIIETLQEIPYKVLWKFEADELPGKPTNVKLIKWAPQQQILSHPNIKLFITQGGLQSMEEGIYSEVPFVVIPFFADQAQNAKLMERKGIAKSVSRTPYIKKADLKKAILDVTGNPSYKAAVKKLKELALDVPMTGIDKAVWWIEYVIRHKGAKHLRSPAADIPLYQYLLLDVISVLLLALIIILAALFLLLRLLYRLIRIPSSGQTVKKLKKPVNNRYEF